MNNHFFSRLLCGFAIAFAFAPVKGAAWEPSTHAGITEQAAIASRFHKILQQRFGLAFGWFERLQIEKADAPELMKILRRLNPAAGYAPDKSGKLTAGGWLMAGAAIANAPGGFGRNHFLDPLSRKGLQVRGFAKKLRQKGTSHHGSIVGSGKPAHQWISDAKNPYSLQAFFTQYKLAITSASTAGRQRHSAGTLLAAGALLHVLQDVSMPEHVRNDPEAFWRRSDPQGRGLGSRLARLAAINLGRLAVPAGRQTISFASAVEFFVNSQGSGLAEKTARRWFSPGTLPRAMFFRSSAKPEVLANKLAASARRTKPTPAIEKDALISSRLTPLRLENQHGVCLAEYQVRDHKVQWSMSDNCLIEQAKTILPTASAYSAGLLQWLFRGELLVRLDDSQIAIWTAKTGLGGGTLTIFSDGPKNNRSKLATISISSLAANSQLSRQIPSSPADSTQITVLFDGVDDRGQPLVASGLAKVD